MTGRCRAARNRHEPEPTILSSSKRIFAGQKNGRLGLGIGLALVIIALDQLTKWWIMAEVFGLPFFDPGERLPFLGERLYVAEFLNLVTVWNRGVSFGLFGDGTLGPLVLSGVAGVICVVLLVWLARVPTSFLGVAIGLVIGGALGNVIDRFRFGAVFDFVDVHAFGYHWPAFNLADAAITVGVMLILYDGIFGKDG